MPRLGGAVGTRPGRLKLVEMSRVSEPTYRVQLPGSTRYCADETELSGLLGQYMAARPDDPLLARVKIYEYADDPDSARPLPIDRFVPEPAEEPTAPASIPATRRRVAPAPAVAPPTPKPAPRPRARNARVDQAPLAGEELFELMLGVLRDRSAPRRDRIQAASSLAERTIGNPGIRAELKRIRAGLHQQEPRETAA